GLGGGDLGLEGGDLLAGDQAGVRCDGALAAREIGLGAFEHRVRAVDGDLRLVDGERVTLAVDDDEDLPLLDRLALVEVHAVAGARAARDDVHLLERGEHARRRNGAADRLLGDRLRLDGEDERATSAAAAPSAARAAPARAAHGAAFAVFARAAREEHADE